jgi:hypothetical protein
MDREPVFLNKTPTLQYSITLLLSRTQFVHSFDHSDDMIHRSFR